MVDVVRSNFSAVLPHVEECIRGCDFLAVDTEFTGLHATAGDEPSLFDSVEERYSKLRRFAEVFIICQFGLSTFKKDPKKNRYVAHTFNFYIFPKYQGNVDSRVSFQASNVDFLCKHGFDFNKLFFEGIPYLNSKQEAEIRSDGEKELSEIALQEALGFTHVFRALERAKKPLLGHNMLKDLALMYHKFHEPLPESYLHFKATLHRLFPTILDTKSLCFGVQRRLSQTKLLEFTSLADLYEALGSQRGMSYVLYTPEVSHADSSQKYTVGAQQSFHEAGFDAFCVGYVFLRVAHLLAMKNVKSTDARPVHLQHYLRIVRPYMNRVNIIRGPVDYIDLQTNDPPSSKSEWLVITTRDRTALTTAMLQEQVSRAMDVRYLSPCSAVVVLGSKRRAQELVKSDNIYVRNYRWWTDSLPAQRLLRPGLLGVGLLTAVAGVAYIWLRT